MTSLDRWVSAQTAERQHQIHESIASKGTAKQFYDEHFGFDVFEYLRGERLLVVGGGTGFGHSFDTTESNVIVDPLLNSFDTDWDESNARLVSGAGESLPFDDDTFSMCICNNVLDHVLSPSDIVAEIRRVLDSETGELLMSTNVFDGPKLLRSRLQRFDPPHPFHFSPREIIELLTSHNFDVEETRFVSHEADKGDLKKWAAVQLLNMRRMNIIAICE